MFFVTQISQWFGFGSLPQLVLQFVEAICISMFGINTNSVYGFLSFLVPNFVNIVTWVFFAVGAVLLVPQYYGYISKYFVGLITGEMTESPLPMLGKMFKTIFLMVIYPFGVIYLMLRFGTYTTSVLPTVKQVQGGAVYQLFAEMSSPSTSGTTSAAVTSTAAISAPSSGISTTMNQQYVTELISKILSYPFVQDVLTIILMIMWLFFLFHVAMDFINFVLFTMISPLAISLDVSGFGTFQELFGKQSAILFTQILRIWVFGLACAIPSSAPGGMVWSLLLFGASISVDKLLSFMGLARNFNAGAGAKSAMSAVTSAVRMIGMFVAG